jgi:hypothetical protein
VQDGPPVNVLGPQHHCLVILPLFQYGHMNLVIQLEKQGGVQPPQVPSVGRLKLEKHGRIFLGEEHFR